MPAAGTRQLVADRYDPRSMTTQPAGSIDVRMFQAGDLAAAATLLADRHRRHRIAEPLLDPAYEDPAAARLEIEAQLAIEGATAWTALRDGAVAGYVIGAQKDPELWGPNIWVEVAGHAADHPSVVRALYAVAADVWLAAGAVNQHALVPASDPELVDAWFSLDFGTQHFHAVREVPPASFGVVPRSEFVIRRPTREDIPALAELELVLPRHLIGAPVFSRLKIPPVADVEAELAADFDDPSYTTFVAEHDGIVVGSAIGCALSKSSGATSLNRPANAGFLAYAAVLPAARGLGVGKALAETVLAWARDAGYPTIQTDWRSTNIEADRSWRGLDFRPTFRRMHRSIT